jgi:hypothetical protein
MKKTLLVLTFLLVPAVTLATVQTLPWWHDSSGFSYPYVKTDYVKAPYFVATSTTATSTFSGLLSIGTTTVSGTNSIIFGDPIHNIYSSGTHLKINGGSYLDLIADTISLTGAIMFPVLQSDLIPDGEVFRLGTTTSRWKSLDVINATTTDVTVSGTLYATVKQYSSFTYATTTAWSGTTTIPLGTAYVAETWNGAQCYTDAGFLNVQFSDGTNVMNTVLASTTVQQTALSSNNTFTATEKRYVNIGTATSSPKKVSCTISKSVPTQ